MILTICYDIIVDNVLQNLAICYCWGCPGQLYFSIRTSQGNNILWLFWDSRFRCSRLWCCTDSCCSLWCWRRCSRGNTVSCITDERKLEITDRQIIDLREYDKSQRSELTKFHNLLFYIFHSPHLFSYLNQSDSSGKPSAIFYTRAWLQLLHLSGILFSAKQI